MRAILVAPKGMDPAQYATTIDESWAEKPLLDLPYGAAAEFVINALREGHGRKCLVIGSPRFEIEALQYHGWNVIFLDVRVPPFNCHFVQGDICRIPFADESFDAVSSTCVICHAGLGRYGDPVNKNGDKDAMKEVARVLKPGGLAAVSYTHLTLPTNREV